MVELWRQTRLLLWKNYLLKLRHPISTLSEVVLPLAFVLLVVWLQTLDPDTKVEKMDFTCPRRSPMSPSLFGPRPGEKNASFIFEMITSGTGPGLRTVPPFAYLLAVASKLNSVIAIAPKDGEDVELRKQVQAIHDTFDEWTKDFDGPLWGMISDKINNVLSFGLCRFKKISKIFKSFDELNEYVQSPKYGSSVWSNNSYCGDKLEKPKIHMALIINKIDNGEWDYTIQTNMSVVPKTYPQMGFYHKLQQGVFAKYIDMYAMSGFLTLQQAMDRYIINNKTVGKDDYIQDLSIRQICDMITPFVNDLEIEFPSIAKKIEEDPKMANLLESFDCQKNLTSFFKHSAIKPKLSPFTTPVSFIPNDVRFAEFPTPEYTDRPFYLKIRDTFSLDLILTFLWPVSRLIRGIVHEKETKLREGMRMMGLQYGPLYLAWFLTYGALFFIIALCITLMTHGGLFSTSSPTLIFLYFFLFGMSIISYCFMVSVLFSRAKTASTAGVVLFFMGYFGYFGVQSDDATIHSKTLSCLLSPTAFGLGAQTLASYEASGQGVTWKTAYESENPNSLPFITIIYFLVFDMILYFCIMFYLDNVLPQEFGVRKPFYFLFTKKYWFPKKSTTKIESINDDDEEEEELENNDEIDESFFETPSHDQKEYERANRCLKLKNLTKKFQTANGVENIAVNKLNLTMYEDQIFVLLGHNGAGKSTTIGMLSGLIPSTSGTAKIFGMDIGSDMSSIRETLGVCPQHDVLFPELTVEEHLVFFANLKNVKNIQAEVDKQISQIDLVEKRNVMSKNLSGGQKRKLSVAIALLGDSKIVFLDEPTSGMDVYARRSCWSMLQNNRKGRIIILTTHFMDEADLLGDRIGIMADGKLQCCGTSMFLKSKYGIGYTLTFALELNKKNKQDNTKQRHLIGEQVVQNIPDAHIVTSVGGEVSVKIPFQSSKYFPKFFKLVDENLQQWNISSYGISITTIEEVFLKIASDEYVHNVDNTTTETNENIYHRITEEEEEASVALEKELEQEYNSLGESEKFFIHLGAMFKKRMNFAKRDRKSLCCNTILPILLLVLGLQLMKSFPLESPPPLVLDMDQLEQSINYVPYNVSDNNHNDMSFIITNDDNSSNIFPIQAELNTTGVNNTCKLEPNPLAIPDGNHIKALSEWVLRNRKENASSLYGAIQFDRVESDLVETTILTNSSAKHVPGIFMNYFTNQILKSYSSQTTKPKIKVTNHPFPFTASFENLLSLLQSTNASITIVIAFAFVPASVAIFIVKEREVSAKHQQLISGGSILAYWVSSFLWDMLMYIFAWVLSILLVYLFNIPSFQGENLWAISLLLFLYGFAVIPFTYCISFLFESHSTAQNVVLLFNFVTGLVLLIASIVMSAIESTQATDKVLRYVYRLFPGFCLGNGLLTLSINDGLKSFNFFGKKKSPFDLDIAGTELIYLAASGIVYFIIAVLIDYGLSSSFFTMKSTTPNTNNNEDDLEQNLLHGGNNNNNEFEKIDDKDVAEERDRIDGVSHIGEQDNNDEDILVVKHLTKIYGDGKVAVRGLSFGIPKGECFGFLGVNGAGKTTTTKMLTGEIIPSSGTAKLVGYDILREQQSLRRKLGYCPQFDALLELLTVREHLELYARIKCVPNKHLNRVVCDKIKELNLDSFADCTAGTLSGGNKRKLSVAIAMIGSPPIIFCDEPTSGMDPLNRRFLLDVLSRITSEKRQGTVILTSHSMEECEALCTKVGILVGGQFQCYGSIQHLKSRFGKGMMLNIKFKPPIEEETQQMFEKLDQYIDHDKMIVSKENLAQIFETTFSFVQQQNELNTSEPMSAKYLVEWLLVETVYFSLESFLKKHFDRVECLEKRGVNVRFKIENEDINLSSLFQLLETSKSQLKVEEYAVTQTSLEQIFVGFAQHQQQSI